MSHEERGGAPRPPGSRDARLAAAAPLLLGALVGAMVAARFETALLCLLVAVSLAVPLKARWPSWRWRISLALSCALGLVLNLYLTPGVPLGEPWPRVLGREPSEPGLALGLLLDLRLIGALVALQALRAAWPGERAADALAAALAPLQRLRVPVSEARLMIGLSLRFAPLLESEARRIARVQDLRAGRPPASPSEWLERRRAAVVPTMVSALERAERVALALEARGYPRRPAAFPGSTTGATWWWRGAGFALFAIAIAWRA